MCRVSETEKYQPLWINSRSRSVVRKTQTSLTASWRLLLRQISCVGHAIRSKKKNKKLMMKKSQKPSHSLTQKQKLTLFSIRLEWPKIKNKKILANEGRDKTATKKQTNCFLYATRCSCVLAMKASKESVKTYSWSNHPPIIRRERESSRQTKQRKGHWFGTTNAITYSYTHTQADTNPPTQTH